MHTVRCSDDRRGVYLPSESVPARGVPAQGDVPARGYLPGVCVYPSMHWGKHPQPPVNRRTDRHYGMSTLYTWILRCPTSALCMEFSFKPKNVLCWRSLAVGTQNTISVILCNYLCWLNCDTGTDVSKKSSRTSFPENNSQRLLHFLLLTTTLSAKIYPICAMTFHANCRNSEFCSAH